MSHKIEVLYSLVSSSRLQNQNHSNTYETLHISGHRCEFSTAVLFLMKVSCNYMASKHFQKSYIMQDGTKIATYVILDQKTSYLQHLASPGRLINSVQLAACWTKKKIYFTLKRSSFRITFSFCGMCINNAINFGHEDVYTLKTLEASMTDLVLWNDQV